MTILYLCQFSMNGFVVLILQVLIEVINDDDNSDHDVNDDLT